MAHRIAERHHRQMEIPRDPMRFDGLELFGNYCEKHGLPISSDDARKAFLLEFDAVVKEMQSAEERLRGMQGAEMFRALMLELGTVEFVRQEDAGRLHARKPIQAPDFRIKLGGGRRLLIEVKDTSVDPTEGALKLPKKKFMRYQEYASLAGEDLLFATFWRRIGVWTLVRPEAFAPVKKEYRLEIGPALLRNQMGVLGDCMVATKPPLGLRAELERMVENGSPSPIAKIRRIVLTCDGNDITDPKGRKLAFFLMMYGRWRKTEPTQERDNSGQITSVSLELRPEDEDQVRQNGGIYVVGWLSSMHASMVHDLTHNAQGQLERLTTPIKDGRLSELAAPDFPFGSSALRLWLFSQTAD